MGCAELQVCLLADCQEWRNVVAKFSDKSSTHLQDGRFAKAQEFVPWVRYVEICAVLSSN